METLKLVEKSSIVKDYEIIEYFTIGKESYIKIKAVLIDDTEFYIKEYFNENEMAYSYHWQTTESELITRWDNAIYHKDISTFPHHKHIGGKVLPSSEINLEEILNFISERIKKK